MEGLVSQTALITKYFQLSEESTAKMVASLVRFGGKDAADIDSFMGGIAGEAHLLGITQNEIAENIANSSHHMYRFNLQTKKGTEQFRKMAGYLTSIGVDISSAIASIDEFRTLPGAMGGAVNAARWGLRMSPMALMASARGGDMSFAFKQILGTIQSRGTNARGDLTQVGIDMADALGPMIGMDRNQIGQALKLMSERNITAKSTARDWKQIGQDSRSFINRLQSSMEKLLEAIVDNPLTRLGIRTLEKIANHGRVVIGGIAAIYAFMRAKQAFNFLTTGAGTSVFDEIKEKLRGRFGKGTKPVGPTFGKQFKAGKVGGAKGMPMATGMSAKGMMGSALAMVAYAGSIWILSKAFQGFAGLEWKTIGQGVVVMGAMALGSMLISKIAPQVIIGALATAAMAASLLIFSKAIQPLIGANLYDIGGGLAVIGASMLALGVGGIATIGILSSMVGLTMIGKFAAKYAEDISLLATSIDILARAYTRIVEVAKEMKSVSASDLLLYDISNTAGSLVAAGAGSGGMIPIETHIRLDLDGTTLTRALVKSNGRRK